SLAGVLGPIMRAGRPGERLNAGSFLAAWPQGVLAITAFACLLATASRGGLLALGAGFLVVLAAIAWLRSGKASPTGGFVSVVCLALVLAVAMFILGGQHAAARFGDASPANQDRLKVFA